MLSFHNNISLSSPSNVSGSHLRSSSSSIGMNNESLSGVGRGGGSGARDGPGFIAAEAVVTLGAGGGGISEAFLLELKVAARDCLGVGCLGVGCFGVCLALDEFGAGVAVAALDSPMVMRMNSDDIPSSLYVTCIGLDGREYSAFTMVLVIAACATMALKSFTLITMCNCSSTENSPNSSVSIAIVVWSGCFRISESVSHQH